MKRLFYSEATFVKNIPQDYEVTMSAVVVLLTIVIKPSIGNQDVEEVDGFLTNEALA